jgi:tRNA 2-selenouridine synthase
MTVRIIEASQAGGLFDAVIDARSPAEFAEDHLPGAANWPVLDDEQRRAVGTLYKQVSPFEARKVGAAMVARNIAAMIERHALDRPRDWSVLVYCWRGGQRSGALAWYLDQIGFRVHVLRGGYKAFRRLVIDALETLPVGLRFHVVCGKTGCGKTRLLEALGQAGEQVLDLEDLAEHRGSVLGGWPDRAQPSQRRFETRLWQALAALDPQRPVWVESESRKIGQVHLPQALIRTMREQGRCVRLEVPDAARVALLLEDYRHLTLDPAGFEALIDPLVAIRGHAAVQAWKALARAGRWAECFASLMQEHYDPGYRESSRRNFAGFDAALELAIDRADPAALADAARRLPSMMESGRGSAVAGPGAPVSATTGCQ